MNFSGLSRHLEKPKPSPETPYSKNGVIEKIGVIFSGQMPFQRSFKKALKRVRKIWELAY
jgi:hypothetical protein